MCIQGSSHEIHKLLNAFIATDMHEIIFLIELRLILNFIEIIV